MQQPETKVRKGPGAAALWPRGECLSWDRDVINDDSCQLLRAHRQYGVGGQTKREPNLVISSLSGPVTRDDVNVEVLIVRLEHETTWTLEVVNDAGTSIVWDDQFHSDSDAYQEFFRTVAEEGMQAFLDKGNVIPFPR